MDKCVLRIKFCYGGTGSTRRRVFSITTSATGRNRPALWLISIASMRSGRAVSVDAFRDC